ncbi:UNVERIFIED_CONTAM: hypothetical protein PYX00_002520 [Menopon gallinae]
MDAEKQSIPSHRRYKEITIQIVLGLVANIANISPGMSLGFSAVALPQLENENATFHVTPEEASWIASIASISTPIGCLLTGSMLDKFGRRATLLTLNVPCLLGWLLIAFAKGDFTLYMIYAGRFFTGLATGMGSAPATIYSAEMSSDSLRGMFVTWTSISISLGILFVYILGYYLKDNWRLIAGLSGIFPVCGIILTWFLLPETPSWLLSKGKAEAAERSFKRMRAVAKNVDLPLSLSAEYQKISEKFLKKSTDKASEPKKNVAKLFFRAGTIKPFIIMNMFFFFQQFSGIFVIIFYAVAIVKNAGIDWDPYLVAILIGITRVAVTIFMSYMSNRFGRRPPSIVSGAGMTICMGILAIFLYLKDTGKISPEMAQQLQWVSITSFILYILTSTIGFLTLPWAMIGEVFPTEVRGLAAGLTTCFAYIFNFIIVKVYPNMVEVMTDYGVFFFYGAFAVFGTAFVVLFLPETQGKTLMEIEEYFSKKKTKKPKKSTDGELLTDKDIPISILPSKAS